MIQDKSVSDSDIINDVTDPTDDQQRPHSMIGNNTKGFHCSASTLKQIGKQLALANDTSFEKKNFQIAERASILYVWLQNKSNLKREQEMADSQSSLARLCH